MCDTVSDDSRCLTRRRIMGNRSSEAGAASKLPLTRTSYARPCPGIHRNERPSVASQRVEREEEDLVRMYLKDIGQYALLTKDDEARLAQAMEAGKAAQIELDEAGKSLSPGRKRELRKLIREGETAERTFVQANLRLVVSIAKKYQASGLPLLDLIQEGNLGLIHAVEKFDWRKGFKFSTYATWWIRQALTRGIANTGRTIRLPVHAGDTMNRVQKARARLEMHSAVRPRWPSSPPTSTCPRPRSPRPCSTPPRRCRSRRRCARTATPSWATWCPTVARPRRSSQLPCPCCPTRSAACWRRSTPVSRRSSSCASASTGASPARSKRSASTST